ncbi:MULTISPECIES: hypothetical protein [Helcococcus]|uniref:Uncharacterized protein n=1 Tax=Helcococcus bovis TaxID=3153252 RepID=A0ABW9F5G8_9FIRM
MIENNKIIKITITLLYSIISIIYEINLNNFNKELVNKSAIEIMFYNSGKAWSYLIFAIFLVIIGIVIVYYFIKEFIKDFKNDITEEKLLINIFTLIFVIFFIFITIILINNPILQAALIVLFGGSIVLANI